jgi:hypothetical protein
MIFLPAPSGAMIVALARIEALFFEPRKNTGASLHPCQYGFIGRRYFFGARKN